ncbi:MAG: FtsQ-type POTRA domain-containing protein [Actinobacteria bacterium]|nr:FtsQ-type POTRA domain-containing protein [Actinomycetota bacterium]
MSLAQLLPRLSPWRILRPLVISASVAALTGVIALVVSYLLFPVTGVEVQGARMFPQSEAWKAVPSYASLLSLNTDAFERKIESNPWVKGAEVLKDWESGIVTVKVEERKAVLDGNLDGHRIVVAADGTKLPGLGGAGLERIEIDETQLEEILGVGEVLEVNGIAMDSVDEVGAGGFEATVEGRRVLFAGEIGDDQARSLKGLIEEHPEAPYFDLRSPERVVIGAEPQVESGG